MFEKEYENCPLLLSQLEEELSGIVEVIGMVSNKGTIMAAVYNMFREEKGISFGERITMIVIDFRTAARSCSQPITWQQDNT